MKSLTLTIAALLITANVLFAQNVRFVTSGSIEYEKSVNTFAIIKKMYGDDMEGLRQQAFDQYKKTQPQFKIFKSTLIFANNKTLFVPTPADAVNNNFFFIPDLAQPNTIYSDRDAGLTTIQKTVFEQTFLVKDTIRKIKWKITDETREIAGYTCRRANGLVMDSIYVVAFFTEKIPVSGGPETFSGLPGMILQVALPHENVSWLATKVTDMTIAPENISPPKKGKVLNNKQLYNTLETVFKNQGTPAQVNMVMKDFML
jgi:GLPGLI family protein